MIKYLLKLLLPLLATLQVFGNFQKTNKLKSYKEISSKSILLGAKKFSQCS